MADKIGFWEGVFNPERIRQSEYEAKESYITPQEKFWYEEYKRQNPEADMSMLGMESVESEVNARQAKRDGPFKGMGEESQEDGTMELGSKPGTFRSRKAKKKKDKDPAKTEGSIWKRAKEMAEMAVKDDTTLDLTVDLVKEYIPEAKRMIDPTEEEVARDRTGLYSEESPNPELQFSGITMPDVEGQGFEGAPMPGMAPTQAQITQPPQNIQLPEGIKTTSEAYKFLTTEQGMSDEDAKAYLRSIL